MVESFGFLPFMYLPPPQRLFSGDADNVEDTASIQKNFNPLLIFLWKSGAFCSVLVNKVRRKLPNLPPASIFSDNSLVEGEIVFIITRPKSACGWQGLAGRIVGQGSVQTGTFWGVLDILFRAFGAQFGLTFVVLRAVSWGQDTVQAGTYDFEVIFYVVARSNQSRNTRQIYGDKIVLSG